MKLLIILSVLYSFSTNAMECGQFQTKVINDGKDILSKEDICIDVKKKFTGAYSKNCTVVAGPKCPFKAVKKGLAYEGFIKEIGSPSFNLCYYLDGQPQMYEIKYKDKWQAFERCFWKETKEFIELAELVEYYRSL